MTEGEREPETTYDRYERLQRIQEGVSLREMRSLSDDELIERHDLIMDPEQGLGSLGAEDFLRELTRRETERQSQRLERLARVLIIMTIVIATLVLVWSELRH